MSDMLPAFKDPEADLPVFSRKRKLSAAQIDASADGKGKSSTETRASKKAKKGAAASPGTKRAKKPSGRAAKSQAAVAAVSSSSSSQPLAADEPEKPSKAAQPNQFRNWHASTHRKRVNDLFWKLARAAESSANKKPYILRDAIARIEALNMRVKTLVEALELYQGQNPNLALSMSPGGHVQMPAAMMQVPNGSNNPILVPMFPNNSPGFAFQQNLMLMQQQQQMLMAQNAQNLQQGGFANSNEAMNAQMAAMFAGSMSPSMALRGVPNMTMQTGGMTSPGLVADGSRLGSPGVAALLASTSSLSSPGLSALLQGNLPLSNDIASPRLALLQSTAESMREEEQKKDDDEQESVADTILSLPDHDMSEAANALVEQGLGAPATGPGASGSS